MLTACLSNCTFRGVISITDVLVPNVRSLSLQLNANQLRSGVEYIVPAGGELAFGLEDETWTAKFEEAPVDDTMAKMMMKAMAAGASDEVKKAVQDATE